MNHILPKERSFLGLKKNRKFYFTDSNNFQMLYYSIYSDQRIYRIEGEFNFIKLTILIRNLMEENYNVEFQNLLAIIFTFII